MRRLVTAGLGGDDVIVGRGGNDVLGGGPATTCAADRAATTKRPSPGIPGS